MKKASTVIIGLVAIGVAFVLLQKVVNEGSAQTILVCDNSEIKCQEYKRRDVSETHVGSCVSLQGNTVCGKSVFVASQVEQEAREGCLKLKGELSNTAPGYYECEVRGTTLWWWPLASKWNAN